MARIEELDLTLDSERRKLLCANRTVELRPQESELLQRFEAKHGVEIPYEELFSLVGRSITEKRRAVQDVASDLRSKLATVLDSSELAMQLLPKPRRGRGYCFASGYALCRDVEASVSDPPASLLTFCREILDPVSPLNEKRGSQLNYLQQLHYALSFESVLTSTDGYAVPELDTLHTIVSDLLRCVSDEVSAGELTILPRFKLILADLVKGNLSAANEGCNSLREVCEYMKEECVDIISDAKLEIRLLEGIIDYYRGDIVIAEKAIERICNELGDYNRHMGRSHALLYGQDPYVAAYGYGAMVRLFRYGMPCDEATKDLIDACMNAGARTGHPWSKAMSLFLASNFYRHSRQAEPMEEALNSLERHLETHHFAFWKSLLKPQRASHDSFSNKTSIDQKLGIIDRMSHSGEQYDYYNNSAKLGRATWSMAIAELLADIAIEKNPGEPDWSLLRRAEDVLSASEALMKETGEHLRLASILRLRARIEHHFNLGGHIDHQDVDQAGRILRQAHNLAVDTGSRLLQQEIEETGSRFDIRRI